MPTSALIQTVCSALLALSLVLVSLVGTPARAAQTQDPIALALAVERRAAATDFAALERFGQDALRRTDREGLNRLYHVTWTFLNQGEFDRASLWNARLAQAADARADARYVRIARLNALTIRYDTGDTAAAAEMARIAATDADWFVKAHATRIHALALMDQDRIGEGLKALNEADTSIPDTAPHADTARAGLWEMTGIGLMKLNDIGGATQAFGRFELDFSNPAYPRPDFDAVYNLTRLSVQVGDMERAQRLYAIHHRLSTRTGMESLSVYDANLCAMVAEGRRDPRGVLRCLSPYGEGLGAADFLAAQLLPSRAIARAQTGDVAGARRDLEAIRAREAAGDFREEGISQIPHVEAELLHAQGRSAEAFALFRAHSHDETVLATQRFSDGIGQVTGDMQSQLTERRSQLETARANMALHADVIASQRWAVGIATLSLIAAVGMILWQRRMTRRLKKAQLRAEDANRSKTEFLANMSHEIRTPLNGVVAMADALSRRSLDAADHDMVQIIRSSGGTLERLLSDILDSAKIEAGQITVEPAPFHLAQAVREVAALYRTRAETKGVTLRVVLEPDLDTMVIGDGVRVRQVLSNLVSNALKFTAQGEVTLDVTPAGPDQVRFTVSDTGIGFDADQKARIFGRFHQADGSITRRFGGTGLGLAISLELARLMGGTLECDSTPGEGATFTLRIPLRAALVPASSAVADPIAIDEQAVPAALRILLADDHPVNRKVIEVLLSSTAATLIAVENGREAVEAFSTGAFDLILMDMQMPVLDGLAATAEIRKLEAARGQTRTPILMLTANAMADHVAAGRAAGADGHLAKPVTLTTLFAGIEAALASVEAVRDHADAA